MAESLADRAKRIREAKAKPTPAPSPSPSPTPGPELQTVTKQAKEDTETTNRISGDTVAQKREKALAQDKVQNVDPQAIARAQARQKELEEKREAQDKEAQSKKSTGSKR